MLFAALLLGLSDPPSLSVPLDCDLTAACLIQQYVDHDESEGRTDYMCGRLSYDGHDGTDFRTRTIAQMQAGVLVLAAAPGVVRAVRDEMPDVSVDDVKPEVIEGREAGNAVVLRHDGGWETQYSHLKRGSITVQPGERVGRGQPLGQIGLSGSTVFPHLEFSVRQPDGATIDPFVGGGQHTGCGVHKDTLWTEEALAAMPYRETAFLSGGITTTRPDAKSARVGAYSALTAAANASALVAWVDVSGVQAGDTEEFVIRRPSGETALKRANEIIASNISWFSFAGVRPPEGGFTTGRHAITYRLYRDDAVIIEESWTATLR